MTRSAVAHPDGFIYYTFYSGKEDAFFLVEGFGHLDEFLENFKNVQIEEA